MPTETPRQHAYSGPAAAQLPEPSHAERVRTLVSLASIAALSTVSRKHPGFPFGSLMPYALDHAGQPIFLISNMAMHTHNILADHRASLFVSQHSADSDPLGAARATILGNIAEVPQNVSDTVRNLYLARHENARYWVDFADFRFFRLEPVDVYYVGGFGVMGWVPASDYTHAAPDPLSNVAQGIIDHMNADHEGSMIELARVHSSIHATEAGMTSIDRLGFHLRLKTPDGMKGTRINFLREVATAQEARAVLVEMVRNTRP